MTTIKQLRKENQELREKVTTSLRNTPEIEQESGHLAFEQAKSIEFISNQYDDIAQLVNRASNNIKEITARINEIEQKCDQIAKAIDDTESYNYRYNMHTLKLFSQINFLSP